MFGALFDSLFSSTQALECEAPGVHAGENPSSQSDTPTDIISDPEQAREHKQALGDKIDDAKSNSGAQPTSDDTAGEDDAAPEQDEEEEEEEVPDVSTHYTRASI